MEALIALHSLHTGSTTASHFTDPSIIQGCLTAFLNTQNTPPTSTSPAAPSHANDVTKKNAFIKALLDGLKVWKGEKGGDIYLLV